MRQAQTTLRDLRGQSFAGQDLRGSSFKDCDLTGADFSDAKLGGCDFTGAVLDEVKFCRARFGRTRKAVMLHFCLQCLAGILSGMFSAIGAFFFISMVKFVLKDTVTDGPTAQMGLVMVTVAGFVGLTWFLTQRQRLSDIFLYLLVAGVGAVAGAGAIVGALAVAVAGAVALAGAVAVAGAVAGFGVGVGAGTAAVAVAVVVLSNDAAANSPLFYPLIISIITIALLSLYLAKRASKLEESQLALMRHFGLKFACLFGCTLAPSSMRAADFSDADLKYTRLISSTQQSCNWHQACNLHLALTTGTLLEKRKVRILLTTGKPEDSADKDFSYLELAGANFSGMLLQGFDFSHSNLAQANFLEADLTGANFTEANLVGANFHQATLSAACIANWNIDEQSIFTDAICSHVFLDSAKKVRNPPNEKNNFGAGDFAALYQQFTHALDFVLRDEQELNAFLRAYEHLKQADDTAAKMQGVERKGETTVVTMNLQEGANREAEYDKLIQAKEQQLLQLQNEHRYRLLEMAASHKEEVAEFKVQVAELATAKTYLEDALANNRKMSELVAARPVLVNVVQHANNRNVNVNDVQQAEGSVLNTGDDVKIRNSPP